MDREVIDWLIASDPAIARLTKRDLLELPRKEWDYHEQEMLTVGWCRRLLDLQDPDGRWGQGLYGPKFISTHYTLMLLRRLEMVLTPEIENGCRQLININAIGSIPTTEPPRVDACITGMGLSILAFFNQQQQLFPEILTYLEDNQLHDGGWNCVLPQRPTKHSSMHTTLLVLEGLKQLADTSSIYRSKINALSDQAHEFLLQHNLFRSHRTGEIIDPGFIDISFPPRWKYNILTALDYFASINHPYDHRMEEAIEIVKQKEKKGRWYQGKQMGGPTFFSTNIAHQGSPFNTVRALRVIRKYL
ncbi:MAG: hypothetical protein ACXAE3_13145 [Candidatus Kariarchaeaceae archaeon]|jgi:hypothetical protein